MFVLVPLRSESDPPRFPRATLAIVVVCVMAFIVTDKPRHRAAASADSEIEKLAAWELQKAAQGKPALEALRARHHSALELLKKDDSWRSIVEPDVARKLDSYVREHRAEIDDHPLWRYGFVPADITPVRLVTHQFLHGDFLHLLFNMMFLWLVGGRCEVAWGSLPFLGFYLVSGVAAALAHALARPGDMEPAIGASGAVAGLMGAFMVTFASRSVPLAMVAFIAMAPRVYFFSAPGWLFPSLWFCEQLLWTIGSVGMNLGIAFWAHVGGFVFGAVASLPLRILRPPALAPG